MDANEPVTNGKWLAHRVGGFDDCAVDGDWYEAADGTRFWRLTVVSAVNDRPKSKRINLHCLVFGGALRCWQVYIDAADYSRRELGHEVSPIDPEVQRGICATVHGWETGTIDVPAI